MTPLATPISHLPLALTSETQWIMIAVGSAFMMYIILRPWIAGKKGRASDPLANQPFRTSLAQQKALERDMQNLVVELHAMARQMSAQVETRVAKLELLLEEADGKIARLERQTRDAEPMPQPIAADRPTMRIASSDANVESPPGTNDRYAELYDLADQGLDARAIATRLQRPAGEIELILALRLRVRAAPDAPDHEVTEPPAIASA
jgi:hypothetical protein